MHFIILEVTAWQPTELQVKLINLKERLAPEKYLKFLKKVKPQRVGASPGTAARAEQEENIILSPGLESIAVKAAKANQFST